MNAIAAHGKIGAYQKLTDYGDTFAGSDELAWAAAAMYAATGNTAYQSQLFQWYNPSDPATLRWTWWRLYGGYGCAARTYAFAASSGRLNASQLNPAYLAQCTAQIQAAGTDALTRSSDSAYGTAFDLQSKRSQTAGWYFGLDRAFDMAVAYQLNPNPPIYGRDPHEHELRRGMQSVECLVYHRDRLQTAARNRKPILAKRRTEHASFRTAARQYPNRPSLHVDLRRLIGQACIPRRWRHDKPAPLLRPLVRYLQYHDRGDDCKPVACSRHSRFPRRAKPGASPKLELRRRADRCPARLLADQCSSYSHSPVGAGYDWSGDRMGNPGPGTYPRRDDVLLRDFHGWNPMG